MTLDNLDAEIIRLLVNDARVSNKAIADATNVTVATVASRLKKLFDSNAIKILPTFDWNASGFEVEAYVYIEISRTSPSAVAQVVSTYPGVLTAAVTLGGFDLILLVVLKDENSLYDLISRISDVEGVANVQLDRIFKVCLYQAHTVKLPAKVTNPNALPSPVIVLDALDRKIIKALQSDGRLSSREIGRQLAVHDAKIRSRIRRMEESGLMALRTIVNPLRGQAVLQPSYVVAIVAMGNPSAVAERLQSIPGVIFVALTQGRFEFVTVISTPFDDFKVTLDREIWGHADVRSVKSFAVLDTLKATADLIRI
jgi:Lrp/AsnC family transcriptional regulator for asnA, asnC and gidA